MFSIFNILLLFRVSLFRNLSFWLEGEGSGLFPLILFQILFSVSVNGSTACFKATTCISPSSYACHRAEASEGLRRWLGLVHLLVHEQIIVDHSKIIRTDNSLCVPCANMAFDCSHCFYTYTQLLSSCWMSNRCCHGRERKKSVLTY